jgi:hypothetical protein
VPEARWMIVVSGLVLHEDENLCHELHELGRSDSATNYTNWDELFFFFVKIREIRGEDPPLYFTTRLVSSDSAPKRRMASPCTKS